VPDRPRAMEWIEAHVVERAPVFLPGEIPEDVLQALRRLDLVTQVPGGVLVVRSPGDDPAAVLRSLVWPIVEALTRLYEPAVVERDSAVRLYLGKTDPVPEIRIRQTGRTRWREEIAPGVVVRVERGDVTEGRRVSVGEAGIPVDAPETILLMLPLGVLRERLGDVALWLKSLVLSRPALTEAYRRRPRPVVLKRIEHIARDVGNERLADLLGRLVSQEQRVRIGRGRTGVGRELVVPALVVETETTRQPWLDRLRVAVRASREQVEPILEGLDASIRSGSLGDLLEGAREGKAYDAYHSSSIEGYRISMEEVSMLLGGAGAGEEAIEDLRSKLAILGYGVAFDNLLARIEKGRGTVHLTGDLALDLYVDLFAPSVEAGIVAAEELRGWRTGPVFIRDTLFVPPGPEKVPRMIDLVFDELREIDPSKGLLRAILTHLWFVWIHPFPDGNGRVARFLMNAALLGGGLPWLTIRVEQRSRYFAALRRAQLDDEYQPFARFIAESFGEGSVRPPGRRE
jgi:hypothetical protein